MPYPGSFHKDELLKIALFWGKHDDIENESARIDKVRWEFIKFYGLQKKPRLSPPRHRIKTVVDRFLETGSVLLKPPPKVRVKTARTDENVARVEELIRADKSLSITALAITLFLSWATVWRILRIDLKFYPYKSKCVNRLTDDHKRNRAAYCLWVEEQFQQDPNWSSRVIWTDEKLFKLKCRGNRQNERYWAPQGQHPEVLEECRVLGGDQTMCWSMIVDGRVYLYWFEPKARIDQHRYLRMLQEFMKPIIDGLPGRDSFIFQQDGARCHTTPFVLAWLKEEFDGRVISGNTDTPYPACSPDLTPPDFWLWGVILAELRRLMPTSIPLLQNTAQSYCEDLPEDDVRRATAHCRLRAQVCAENGGSHFEHQLKKRLNNPVEE